MWRAIAVFTKGHYSTSADVLKNLTANVFNDYFLSVSESLIELRTNVYECSNPPHDFCKQKTSGQDPFVIPYLFPFGILSVLSKFLEKHVHIYLNDYLLKKRQLLHPFQSGFRRKYSGNTALARLTNCWLTDTSDLSMEFVRPKEGFRPG